MRHGLRTWGTPITLVVLIGLLAFGAWWGWTNLTRPIVAKTEPCVSQSVGSELSTEMVTVRVYNGGRRTGLARSVSAQLTAQGFKVPYAGNTKEEVKATIIVGANATDPEVLLVAAFFPGSTIRADQRVDHSVDVLVGDDFAGFNDQAARTIEVPGGTVCLPGSSASASVDPSAQPT